MRKLLLSAALGLASVTAVATTTSCAAPPAVHALLQRTSCNSTHVKPAVDACTHWVNTLPAWGYPADTEWVGPYSDFQFDLRNNGAVELP
jgi:hypothetical protein